MSLAFSATNTGVSSIRSRTYNAMPINTALIRNGIRQPHSKKAGLSSPMVTLTPRNVRHVSTAAAPPPSRVNMP